MSSSQPIRVSAGSPGTDGFRAEDLSVTPGGTMFGVTPGGTKIIYKREDLMLLSKSPLSRTPPPAGLNIPAELLAGGAGSDDEDKNTSTDMNTETKALKEDLEDEDMFKME